MSIYILRASLYFKYKLDIMCQYLSVEKNF